MDDTIRTPPGRMTAQAPEVPVTPEGAEAPGAAVNVAPLEAPQAGAPPVDQVAVPPPPETPPVPPQPVVPTVPATPSIQPDATQPNEQPQESAWGKLRQSWQTTQNRFTTINKAASMTEQFPHLRKEAGVVTNVVERAGGAAKRVIDTMTGEYTGTSATIREAKDLHNRYQLNGRSALKNLNSVRQNRDAMTMVGAAGAVGGAGVVGAGALAHAALKKEAGLNKDAAAISASVVEDLMSYAAKKGLDARKVVGQTLRDPELAASRITYDPRRPDVWHHAVGLAKKTESALQRSGTTTQLRTEAKGPFGSADSFDFIKKHKDRLRKAELSALDD